MVITMSDEKHIVTVKLNRDQILSLLSAIKYSENSTLMAVLRDALYDVNAQIGGMMRGRHSAATCNSRDDDNILTPNDPVDW